MAQFPPALDYLLNFEDRPRSYVETVDNNGGKVIAGINSRSYPGDEAVVAALPTAQRGAAVAQFYLAKFWTPLLLGGLESQDIANRVLALAVNAYFHEAVLILQRAVNMLKPGALLEDGTVGPLTLAAANAADPDSLLAAYRQQSVAFYDEILARHPEDEPDRAGWMARAEA